MDKIKDFLLGHTSFFVDRSNPNPNTNKHKTNTTIVKIKPLN